MNNEYGMKLKELHDIYESKYVKLEKELKEKDKTIMCKNLYIETYIRSIADLKEKIKTMDKVVNDLQKEVIFFKKEDNFLRDVIVELEKEISVRDENINEMSDTCQTCGCNEFLCGHNKKD